MRLEQKSIEERAEACVRDLPSAETESFDDLIELIRLLCTAEWRFFADDDIGVDVGMNDVSICGPTDRSANSHEAVLFRMLQNGTGFLIGSTERFLIGILVGLDPHNVFATTVSPFVQTMTSSLQSLFTPTPVNQPTSLS